MLILFFFFFNDTATTEIYTLSLHDALPICDDDPRRHDHGPAGGLGDEAPRQAVGRQDQARLRDAGQQLLRRHRRSEEHTSELQSRQYLVCRLLLEKKKTNNEPINTLIST